MLPEILAPSLYNYSANMDMATWKRVLYGNAVRMLVKPEYAYQGART